MFISRDGRPRFRILNYTGQVYVESDFIGSLLLQQHQSDLLSHASMSSVIRSVALANISTSGDFTVCFNKFIVAFSFSSSGPKIVRWFFRNFLFSTAKFGSTRQSTLHNSEKDQSFVLVVGSKSPHIVSVVWETNLRRLGLTTCSRALARFVKISFCFV